MRLSRAALDNDREALLQSAKQAERALRKVIRILEERAVSDGRFVERKTLYQYGRLHRTVRLRRGTLDERLPVPWTHPDEPWLYELMKTAAEARVPLEVVVGGAPDFAEPWARAQLAYVQLDDFGLPDLLRDERGRQIVEDEVQLARLPSLSG